MKGLGRLNKPYSGHGGPGKQGKQDNLVEPDMQGIRSRHSLLDDLSTLWPGVRYLSLGIWFSWVFVAFSGTFWLSDVETHGNNLASMYIFFTAACAVILLVAAPLAQRFKPLSRLLLSRTSVIGAGVLAMLGALFIILAGPYYLGNPPLFYVGDILTGIGAAILTLKCGHLFGELSPWRALIYVLLSQLIVVVIFFFVLGNQSFHPIAGGPSLAGILALMLLPLCAAILMIIRPPSSPRPQDPPTTPVRLVSPSASVIPGLTRNLEADVDPTPAVAERSLHPTTPVRLVSPVFSKFLVAIFIFTLATSIVRGLYTNISAPSALLVDTSTQMLFRAFFFVTVLLLAIRFFKFINFGKPYLFFMGLIAAIIALSPLLRIYNDLVVGTISFSFSLFDVLVWCLLAFIVFEKHLSPIVVFGFGRGIFMAGSALGWIIGTRLMPQILGSNLELATYIIMALLILISTTLVFTEKDFDSLFLAVSEIELDLEEVAFDSAGTPLHSNNDKNGSTLLSTAPAVATGGAPASQDPHSAHERPYLTACRTVGKLAKLSSREQSILELLAMGRGSENIAKRLSISLNTVRTHTHNIYAKLDVHSRQELIDLIEQTRDHH